MAQLQPTGSHDQDLTRKDAADELLQATCEAIVTMAATTLDAEPQERTVTLNIPGGAPVGKQMTIDAAEVPGMVNMCRLAVLNPAVAPEGEVARIEYEHDKKGQFGLRRVYSIQSVRRQHGELILMENFLADSPKTVREADFRPITSEKYAQQTVLKVLQDWTRYRAWQLQEQRKQR